MSSLRAQVYSELYKSTLEATVKAAEAVPADKRLHQAAHGKAHPLWLLGHVTMSLDMLTNNWMLGLDMVMPREWGRTFGPSQFGGSPITTDAASYPAWDEILETYKKAGANAVEKLASLTDEDLAADALGPMPDQFKENFGKLTVSLPANAVHDAHHRGQMALLCGLD